MAELDHLVYATPDLDASVAHIAELTGVTPVFGGRHDGFGTMNHLLTFDDRTYFEIIGVDPDQPEPSGPRPFGIDELGDPALVAYAIHPSAGETLEDLRAAYLDHGFDPGDVASMGRDRPDGTRLEWRLSVGGDTGFASGGTLPFLIDWGTSASPASTLPTMGALTGLRVGHPDPAVHGLLAALDLGIDIHDGVPALHAAVDAPTGTVELT